jgi:hypothetical protein
VTRNNDAFGEEFQPQLDRLVLMSQHYGVEPQLLQQNNRLLRSSPACEESADEACDDGDAAAGNLK